jgi:hypothetical protein
LHREQEGTWPNVHKSLVRGRGRPSFRVHDPEWVRWTPPLHGALGESRGLLCGNRLRKVPAILNPATPP